MRSRSKDGSRQNADTERSVRYGVTDPLRLSLGTLTDDDAVENVPTFANRTAMFGGVIVNQRDP